MTDEFLRCRISTQDPKQIKPTAHIPAYGIFQPTRQGSYLCWILDSKSCSRPTTLQKKLSARNKTICLNPLNSKLKKIVHWRLFQILESGHFRSKGILYPSIMMTKTIVKPKSGQSQAEFTLSSWLSAFLSCIFIPCNSLGS